MVLFYLSTYLSASPTCLHCLPIYLPICIAYLFVLPTYLHRLPVCIAYLSTLPTCLHYLPIYICLPVSIYLPVCICLPVSISLLMPTCLWYLNSINQLNYL